MLNVPFSEKDAAKAAGCRWDRTARAWWTGNYQPAIHGRWLPLPDITDPAPPAPELWAEAAEETLRQQPAPRGDSHGGEQHRPAPQQLRDEHYHWDLVEPSDYLTEHDLDWVDLDADADADAGAVRDPGTPPTPDAELPTADLPAADFVNPADVFDADDDTWLRGAAVPPSPPAAAVMPSGITAGGGVDAAAVTPPRYNKGLVIAFTAATVLVAIGVTSMLLGMRSRPAIDTGFQAGSETQISVVAATAAPEADTTALDTPVPFMATATCPAGSTPAQSVAGDDPTRAWVCVRGGTDGQVLTLELGQPMMVTAVSITPGWVGTDANGVDQWPSHRVVSRVQWIFDNDPTTVMTQTTGNIRGEAVQPVPGRGVLASTITMIVLQTSRPPLDVAPTETAGPGGGLLGGGLPPVPTETFPAPRFGAGDTRPEPVDSTFAVSSIKVLGHTPE
jgi:hypothetical protein